MGREANDRGPDDDLRFVVAVGDPREGEPTDRVELRRLLIRLAAAS